MQAYLEKIEAKIDTIEETLAEMQASIELIEAQTARHESILGTILDTAWRLVITLVLALMGMKLI